MKKGILLLAIVLALPMFCVGAKEPVFDVGHLFYTNKSPFLLEGMIEPGSTVTISGVESEIMVGKDGKFAVDLPIKEGVNLFSMVIDNEGTSTIKGIMVEMDSTPPEVNLSIDGKLISENGFEIETYNKESIKMIVFTEPSCQIQINNENVIESKSTRYELAISIDDAPSRYTGVIKVSDKFGNESVTNLQIKNVYRKTVALVIGSDTIYVDNRSISIPDKTKFVKSSIMVSLRVFAFDIIGGNLSYNVETKTVTISSSYGTLICRNNIQKVIFDDKEVSFTGTPPFVENGHTMVPLKDFSELFGFEYTYSEVLNTAKLSRDFHP